MANKKFTDLATLTTAATDDVLAIVDTSANTSKQIAVSGLAAPIASSLPAGSVATAAIADDAVTPAKWTNPYCFHATLTSNQSIGATTWTKINFVDSDTLDYDLNNNFNNTSHEYTVPVDGIYHFDTSLQQSGTPVYARTSIYVNGSAAASSPYNSSDVPIGKFVAADLNLSAGDTVAVYVYHTSSGTSYLGTTAQTFFNGHLVSPQ